MQRSVMPLNARWHKKERQGHSLFPGTQLRYLFFQAFCTHGFGQTAVEPAGKNPSHVLRIGECGHCDDRYVGRQLADGGRSLVTVHFRHLDIHQDHAGTVGPEYFYGFRSMRAGACNVFSA